MVITGYLLLGLALVFFGGVVVNLRRTTRITVSFRLMIGIAMAAVAYFLGAYLAIQPYRPIDAIAKAWWLASALLFIAPVTQVFSLWWKQEHPQYRVCHQEAGYCLFHTVPAAFYGCLLATLAWTAYFFWPTYQVARGLVLLVWPIYIWNMVTARKKQSDELVRLGHLAWSLVAFAVSAMAVLMTIKAYGSFLPVCAFGGCFSLLMGLIWLVLISRVLYQLKLDTSLERHLYHQARLWLANAVVVLFLAYSLPMIWAFGALSDRV